LNEQRHGTTHKPSDKGDIIRKVPKVPGARAHHRVRSFVVSKVFLLLQKQVPRDPIRHDNHSYSAMHLPVKQEESLTNPTTSFACCCSRDDDGVAAVGGGSGVDVRRIGHILRKVLRAHILVVEVYLSPVTLNRE
jgi:alcohol dehydrogenase class IV